MTRWKLYAYGSFAFCGTVAMAVYFFRVSSEAPSSFDLALLIFSLMAALVGWLGLWISWLTYRLEAGKVPRPDVRILAGGEQVKEWKVPITLKEPRQDFTEEIEKERLRLESLESPRKKSGEPMSALAMTILNQPSSAEIVRYRRQVDSYLKK